MPEEKGLKEITSLRKKGIAGRDSLERESRLEKSRRIVHKIILSEEYKNANTIMIYKAIRGEVRLELLEEVAKRQGKTLAYPLCLGEGIMIALHPENEEAWKKGSFGICEPVREKSLEISPEKMDLIICPCTVFDEDCNRIGMGGGYYDRYLPLCTNAHVISVAFDAQKADHIPLESWDYSMEKTYTESTIYVRKKRENIC